MTFEYVEGLNTSESETDTYLRIQALKLAITVVEINVSQGQSPPKGWLYDRADDFVAYLKDGTHPKKPEKKPEPSDG